ncbi:MFS transporter [Candidatus Tisiphia endosymbiont of Micropterix aruncella]|uniref:MFS transporter n=1 Tax=Candidatus Tisiphia endosymbiont of Micropterix aruncella TaxID=3066271 RepID=UPI003AA97F4C
MNKALSLKKPLLLWSLATLFFAFQFILRLSTGILREEIIQKFAIDTIAFGTFAGYYYLGYAGMQLPIGIMLDKFNFRIVTFLSILVTSLGTLTFVASIDFNYLLIGRFMIGAGSAVGFLSVAKITRSSFPAKYHSLMLGLSFTFGLLGAVFGITPMKLLFTHFGYDVTFNSLALVGFIIGLMILLVKTDDTRSNSNTSDSEPSILKLLLNPTILFIGVCGGLMVGALEGFADVWAIPFFKQVYQMNDMESNLVTSFVYIGMCFGGPILALIANLSKSSNFIIIMTGLLTVAIFSILLYCPSLSFFTSSSLMFLLGIFCCYQVLIFTVVGNLVTDKSAGIAIAIVNCINMSFGHFFHKIMSNLISYNWDGLLSESAVPIYSRFDFIMAISIIPICCFIGITGFWYLSKRSKTKTQILMEEETVAV